MSNPTRSTKPAAAVATALLLAGAAPVAVAQVDLNCDPAADPVFLAEGPVSAVTDNGDGSGAITAMGVVIEVPATAPVATPTAVLDMATFADAASFPGRTESGFIGATVIANGCVKFTAGDPTAVPPVPPEPFAVATDVFSDVAENVLLGVVTAPLANDTFGVDGTTVALLADPRMPAGPVTNAFGFEVDPVAALVPPANVAVEGYYGDDDVLYVWSVEVDGAALVDPDNPQISIQRFRCANDVQVQGGIYLGTETCTFGAPFSLALFDGAGNEIPFAPGDLDVLDGVAPDAAFCSYDLRTPVTACPESVRIVLLDNGNPAAEATAP